MSDDERAPLADGPLQGLRVVEFGQQIAGPYVGSCGAEVVKIYEDEYVRERELLIDHDDDVHLGFAAWS